jgi:hypothetical protein
MAPGVMNVGPENREPSRQIGYAQSSLSPATSSKSELEAAVAGLLKIKKAHPGYDAVLHAAIQVMTDQDFAIDFLSRALADVRCQLKALPVDLVLDNDVQEAIGVMQSGILIILDMLELDDGVIQLGGDAASSSSSFSSPSSFSTSPPSSSSSSPPSSSTTATRNQQPRPAASACVLSCFVVERGAAAGGVWLIGASAGAAVFCFLLLLFAFKKGPDLAPFNLGEGTTYTALFIRSDLAHNFVYFLYQTLVFRFMEFRLSATAILNLELLVTKKGRSGLQLVFWPTKSMPSSSFLLLHLVFRRSKGTGPG